MEQYHDILVFIPIIPLSILTCSSTILYEVCISHGMIDMSMQGSFLVMSSSYKNNMHESIMIVTANCMHMYDCHVQKYKQVDHIINLVVVPGVNLASLQRNRILIWGHFQA